MLAKLFTAKNRDGSFYSTKQVTVAAGSILGAGEKLALFRPAGRG